MKMKIRNIVSSLALVILLLLTILTVNVSATSDTLPAAKDNKITLTEDVTLTAGFIVEKGTTLTIDLAGHTLTLTKGVKADTILVEKGASLEIVGDGTITNNTKGYGALFNNGTVTIDGATLKRDTTGGNNWYVICNHGEMLIKDANVSVNGTGSSLVENGYYDYTSTNSRNGYVEGVNAKEPTLTIKGGVFDGGMNTIKNDDGAVLTIDGGTFQNNYQVAVMNWNKTTINNGTFKTPTGNDKTNLFVGSAGVDTVDKGILIINGGKFEAEYLVEGYKGVTTPVKINGGTINTTKGIVNEGNAHNTLVVAEGIDVVGEVTAPLSILKYAKKGATVTITDEVKIGDKMDVPEGVKVVLTNDDEDKVVVKNEDGTYTVEYKDADYSKVEAAIAKVKALKKEDYKDFSKVDAAVKAVEYGKNITEQKVVDGYARAIEDAIAGLEKVEVNEDKEKQEEIKNPQTGDNVLVNMVVGFVALVTVVGIVIYKKQK